MHSLLAKAQQKQPDVFSVFFNGQQILRIEDGETVLEHSVSPRPGLLTIHFDDDPMPEYVLTLS